MKRHYVTVTKLMYVAGRRIHGAGGRIPDLSHEPDSVTWSLKRSSDNSPLTVESETDIAARTGARKEFSNCQMVSGNRDRFGLLSN